jgi:hypothetical protein
MYQEPGLAWLERQAEVAEQPVQARTRQPPPPPYNPRPGTCWSPVPTGLP